MENSTFVSDSELNRYINYSINMMRDKMIIKTGEEYFASTQSYSLVDGTEEYNLPNDFYKVISCQILGDSGLYFPMKRFEYSEQNENARPLYYRNADLRYRIRGAKLVVNPSTNVGGRTIRLIYVPIPTELAADGDTLEGFNGWDEYVVLSAAIKCLQKEEQDVSDLKQELAVMDARMDTMMDNRDHSQPARVQDTSRLSRGARYYLV
jgi:hypothetical protein